MGTYSKLCEWRCLHQQIVPLTKCAGIDAQASQGVQPLVRNEVTQNSPDFNRPGCLPRRAHIQGLPLYRSAPFVPKGFRLSFLCQLCCNVTFFIFKGRNFIKIRLAFSFYWSNSCRNIILHRFFLLLYGFLKRRNL